MKRICFHKLVWSLLILALSLFFKINAQNVDTLYLGSGFQKENIRLFSKVNGLKPNHRSNFFYFGFEKEYNTVEFCVKNTENNSKDLVLEFTNALIRDIVLLKKKQPVVSAS